MSVAPLVERPRQNPVAHHFSSAQQQFDAGKLGMWLFLVTEVLFFSGLFVAYAVYRMHHPEVFAAGRTYLNMYLGTLNTLVLLLSSLTMAWSVRSAQLGDRRTLIRMLTTTLACAGFFLGVKAVEYGHKLALGVMWAGAFEMDPHHDGHGSLIRWLIAFSIPTLVGAGWAAGQVLRYRKRDPQRLRLWLAVLLMCVAYLVGIGAAQVISQLTSVDHLELTHQKTLDVNEKKLIGVFFSIYYMMTGVHAIHILVGMGVIGWILVRALRHEFGPNDFAPVDFVGLYWHLVDLIWIYLFPLLYLIG